MLYMCVWLWIWVTYYLELEEDLNRRDVNKKFLEIKIYEDEDSSTMCSRVGVKEVNFIILRADSRWIGIIITFKQMYELLWLWLTFFF